MITNTEIKIEDDDLIKIINNYYNQLIFAQFYNQKTLI